jgi:hypothetical protein
MIWQLLEVLAEPDDWGVKRNADGTFQLRSRYEIEAEGSQLWALEGFSGIEGNRGPLGEKESPTMLGLHDEERAAQAQFHRNLKAAARRLLARA